MKVMILNKKWYLGNFSVSSFLNTQYVVPAPLAMRMARLTCRANQPRQTGKIKRHGCSCIFVRTQIQLPALQEKKEKE